MKRNCLPCYLVSTLALGLSGHPSSIGSYGDGQTVHWSRLNDDLMAKQGFFLLLTDYSEKLYFGLALILGIRSKALTA